MVIVVEWLHIRYRRSSDGTEGQKILPGVQKFLPEKDRRTSSSVIELCPVRVVRTPNVVFIGEVQRVRPVMHCDEEPQPICRGKKFFPFIPDDDRKIYP